MAFLLMAAVVAVVVVLLAANIVRHALSPQSTTKVDVTVDTVSCLVGVARPAMPLAFPIHVTEHLSPGVDRQITIDRALIKPVATTVRSSDVALTCT